MSPPPAAGAVANNNKKKKKKGHAPVHQNTFAFTHNPKSKKTAAILAMPIHHVCRRCQDKLEWKKQYRKYKPLTVMSKCNHCQRRNVKAAYHTICEECTRSSPKCLALLQEWNTAEHERNQQQPQPQPHTENANPETTVKAATSTLTDVALEGTTTAEPVDTESATAAKTEEEPEAAVNSEDPPEQRQEHHSATASQDTATAVDAPPPAVYRRVCAMCVKEPALTGVYDQDENEGDASSRPLRLRERKALQRHKEREAAARKQRKKASGSTTNAEPNNNNSEEKDEDSDASSDSQDDDSAADDEDDENNLDAAAQDKNDPYDDEDDPFLKAVGGADKLLTGEAYQQMLLQREQAAKAM